MNIMLIFIIVLFRSTSYTLHFGSIDQSNPNEPGRVTLQSNQVYVHEQYNSQSLENDVALIKLPNQIQFTGMNVFRFL